MRSNSLLRTAVSALIAGTVIGTASAQQAPAPAGQTPPGATFRVSTKLVVQTVTVTDRNGTVVEGLTAPDFAVTEDGVAQDIAFVEFQRVEGAPPAGTPPAAAPVAAAATPVPATPAVALVTQPQISRSTPGDIRYRDRRLLIFYFDLSAMPPPDQARAYSNALTYINTQMSRDDMVAIMTFQGGGVRVKLDFTDSKPALVEAMQRLIFGDDLDGDGLPDNPDPGTAFGQDDAEFNIFNTDRQLAALQTAVSMLRPLPEQKALIYFGSGLRLNGTDNQAQLRATINAAVKSNVTINPIDARGLVASAPLGDATRQSPGGIGMFTGRLAEAAVTNLQRSQDTLFALAKDTGGKAMFDYNDLSLGIREAASSITSYYIVGYYTTNVAEDGKFRRVRITLRNGRQGELAYRQGYYGDKSFARFTVADRERQLEEALLLDDPVTEIPIAMEVNYFQLSRAEYFIPVAVKVPGSELVRAKRGGATRTQIDVIGEIKDDFGITQQNVRDKLDIKLDDATAGQLATRPIQYETGFTLLPGKYVLKFLIRDSETGRMGTYQAAFTVPNLMRELTRLPTSSVVLSSQRVPLAEALLSTKASALTVHPLVNNGQKLIPNVTRVFSRARDLFVYLQAYERDATVTRPLVAFATFFNESGKVFETMPFTVTEGLQKGPNAVPVAFTVPLGSLAPGRYDCQITILEPEGGKAAFWRAPIVVIP
jgi:VWFA-related protein